MTIKEALISAVAEFKKAKIKFPHLEAEILLSHILKRPREYLFAHSETRLTKRQFSGFEIKVSERCKGVPVAYLTGEKEFYGLKFLVDRNVLIPRPETEMMVEEALAIAKQADKPVEIIDVGTGSGCIVISLAKALRDLRFTIYDLRFLATDVSRSALKIAQKNAKFNSIAKDIIFFHGGLLSPILKSKILNLKSFAVITTNLPYLTPTQIKNSPTIKYEPRLALSAGPDGLKYYRRLFRQISRAGLTNFILLCEIDPSQKISIRNLAKQLLPPHTLEIKKDLRGHSRLAVISSE